MLTQCPACNFTVFNEKFSQKIFFSRYKKFIGSDSLWMSCSRCGSLIRNSSFHKESVYFDNDYYLDKEYNKRKIGIKNIVKHINKNCVVFDIGSGSGIISNLLFENGVKVIQVEPFRHTAFKNIPQINYSVSDFFKLRLWNNYLSPNEKAIFIFIDVLEHLSENISVYFQYFDNSVDGVYIETGCVDYSIPNVNRWYYLDYADHVFVPSLLGIKFLFGNNYVIERISNSLHSFNFLNNFIRVCINSLNNISFYLFKKDIFIFPRKNIMDHISIYFKLMDDE